MMVFNNHVRVFAEHERCHIREPVTTEKQGTKADFTTGTSYQDLKIHSQSCGILPIPIIRVPALYITGQRFAPQ